MSRPAPRRLLIPTSRLLKRALLAGTALTAVVLGWQPAMAACPDGFDATGKTGGIGCGATGAGGAGGRPYNVGSAGGGGVTASGAGSGGGGGASSENAGQTGTADGGAGADEGGGLGGGGGGGGGGVAQSMTTGGLIASPLIGGLGGAGGAGGQSSGNASAGYGGDGGSGAFGIGVSDASLTLRAAVIGGAGGAGGVGGRALNWSAGTGGAGGAGGAGLTATGTAALLQSSITGGAGGVGGGGGAVDGNFAGWGGAGGAGATGAIISGGSLTLDTAGAFVRGGAGGVGGAGAYGGVAGASGRGGAGGAGGVGVNLDAGAALVVGASTSVFGGAGSLGGAGGAGAPAGAAGLGGVGITASNATITLAGTVAGGLSASGVRANAITFSGTNNRLELLSGYTIDGNVQGAGATTLALGGSVARSFDMSQMNGTGTQFTGISTLSKEGSGTLTLSGTSSPTNAIAWSVSGGTLDLNGTSQSTTGLTLTDGTLTNGTLSGTITSNNAAISDLRGTAALNVVGNGSITTISGTNTYTGVTSVLDWRTTLRATSANAFSAASEITVGDSATLDLGGFAQKIDSVVLEQFSSLKDGSLSGAILAKGADITNLSGDATLTVEGGGTTSFHGSNTYTGATVLQNQGAIFLSQDNVLSADSETTIHDGAYLDFGDTKQTINKINLAGGLLWRGVLTGATESTGGRVWDISGTASLKTLSGTTVLRNNTYSGATTVAGGTLTADRDNAFSKTSVTTVSTGGTIDLGSYAQAIDSVTLDGGTLKNGTLTGAIASRGGVVSDLAGTASLTLSSGTTTVSGANAYTGATTVNGGVLAVTGTLGSSAVTVNSGGTLQGSGTITQAVSIANGGALTGSAGATLTMGALTLSSGSAIDIDFGATPASGALFDVTGTLTLDGTLNITNTGAFGVGVYRMFNYGTLVNNGLTIGNLPSGTDANALTLRTGGGQVNLVNASGLDLQFWNGPASAGPGSGTVNGGSGTWSLNGGNWSDALGQMNGKMNPMPGFAIFEGTAGTVTVDNSDGQIRSAGMQFITSGYTVTGDPIELADPLTTIRVGDGTTASASTTATMESALTGTGGLQKTDFGTLILAGANSYSGETRIEGGTLRGGAVNTFSQGSLTTVATGGKLDLGGFDQTINSVTLAGGALGNGTLTGAISSSGGIVFDLGGTASLDLTGGTTTLTGTNTFTGAITIGSSATLAGGSVNAFNAATALTAGTGATINLGGYAQAINNITLSGGTLTNGELTGAITSTGGTISNLSGTASLSATSGTTTFAGGNAFTGTTTVDGGTLTASNDRAFSAVSEIVVLSGVVDLGGFAQTINSIALGSGTLKNGPLAGAITSLNGAVENISGTASLMVENSPLVDALTSLSGSNSYTGATTIKSGTLTATTANAFSAASVTTIQAAGTLDLGGLAQSINDVRLTGGTLSNGALSGKITSEGGTVRGLSGTTSLSVTSGTTTLSGANAYTGATTIVGASATLTATAANAFSATSVTTVGSGGVLNLGGFAQSINEVNLAGGWLQNGTLAGAITSTSGVIENIAGTASFTLNSGDAMLRGTNTYTGDTPLNGGTLRTGDQNTLSAASVLTINRGATADLLRMQTASM